MTFVLITFAVLLLGGAPIALAMCVPAVIYLLQSDLPFAVLGQRLPQSLNSFPLLAIPLFILAGRILNEGGITERIFKFADNLVGAVPGGLGHVNVVGSMIFAGMSGTAIADLGGIGQVEVKAMKDAGYPMRFIAGITATSAIVGPVIPPSVPLILFAVASDSSILALFAGGFLPGVIIGICLMIAVYIYSRYADLPRSPWRGGRALFFSFLAAAPPLFAPVLLIGGMMSGVFSPTEAAAVTVFYALFLAVVVYRDLRPSQNSRLAARDAADDRESRLHHRIIAAVCVGPCDRAGSPNDRRVSDATVERQVGAADDRRARLPGHRLLR